MTSRFSVLSISQKIVVISMSVALASCASTPTEIGTAPGITVAQSDGLPMPRLADYTPDEESGLIRALDVIQIEVFGVPELSREVQVSANGTIDYPLIGNVVAAGQTSDELSAAVESRLRNSYVRNPDVVSRITERNEQYFTIGGEVNRPGRFPIASSISLMEAMAIGGGFDEYATKEEVLVFRTVGDERYIGVYNVTAIQQGNYADPVIYPSDIVMVGESTGRRRLQEILSLTTALASPLILVERVLR